MELVTTAAETRQAVRAARAAGLTVGLVPTMGYLHDGHCELIRRARADCGFVVVSIFVNPMQFGPREDYKTYPRDMPRDLDLAGRAGASLVFAPAAEEMYPPGFRTAVEVEGLSDVLCGASRPGHFRGVATVVTKLLHIVLPDRAYFGQKDYQQTLVLRRMARDLDFGLEVVVVPTVRHEDGLAMSSRNLYLSAEERRAAGVLYQVLKLAERSVRAGLRDAAELERLLRARMAEEPLARLDYLVVADPETLEPLGRMRGRVLVALAAFVGRTRLIDNALLDVG